MTFEDALLEAYQTDLPRFRRQAQLITSAYGQPVEADELVQMAVARLWLRRKRTYLDPARARQLLATELRCRAYCEARWLRVRRNAVTRYAASGGVTWTRAPGQGALGPHHTPMGPRLLPELHEIALSEAGARFLKAVARLLNPLDVALLVLHYFGRYTYLEIGRRAQLSAYQVRRRLHAVRATLRKHPQLADLLREAA